MKLQEGQQVTVTATEDRPTAILKGGKGRLDLARTGPHTGTVVDVSESLAAIEIDRGLTIVVDRIQDERVRLANRVAIDLSTWTRLAEVDEFANARGVNRAEAIKLLVNSGLSHR